MGRPRKKRTAVLVEDKGQWIIVVSDGKRIDAGRSKRHAERLLRELYPE